jgi:hypothetical protein
MKEHEINKENYFIKAWYIDESLCDKFVNFYKSNPEMGNAGSLGSPPKVIKEKKDSIDCFLSDFPFKEEYYLNLQRCVDLYIEKFKWCNESDPWTVIEEVNFQHYLPGGGYHQWHCERSAAAYPFCTRHLVFMTYLNDVTEDGETEWHYQKIKIKPEKGLTVIWPVDWTHTHRGIKSETQHKYILTGWFNFFERT